MRKGVRGQQKSSVFSREHSQNIMPMICALVFGSASIMKKSKRRDEGLYTKDRR